MKVVGIILTLFASIASAQTYDLTLDIDGVTYQGSFLYTPSLTVNEIGATIPGPGGYTNVSISDPYAGMLTTAYDVYDGNNLNQHELWLGNIQGGGWMGINIPTGLGGSYIPITGALSYLAPGGGLDYVTCSGACGSIVEMTAPELDPTTGLSAFTLLAGMVIVWKGKRT